MPVEIKELIIRAFIGSDEDQEEEETSDHPEKEQAKAQKQSSADAITIISNMLRQEKER